MLTCSPHILRDHLTRSCLGNKCSRDPILSPNSHLPETGAPGHQRLLLALADGLLEPQVRGQTLNPEVHVNSAAPRPDGTPCGQRNDALVS